MQELHRRLVILISADGGTADRGWEQPRSVSALRAARPRRDGVVLVEKQWVAEVRRAAQHQQHAWLQPLFPVHNS